MLAIKEAGLPQGPGCLLSLQFGEGLLQGLDLGRMPRLLDKGRLGQPAKHALIDAVLVPRGEGEAPGALFERGPLL